jgi:hypothetical protein
LIGVSVGVWTRDVVGESDDAEHQQRRRGDLRACFVGAVAFEQE